MKGEEEICNTLTNDYFTARIYDLFTALTWSALKRCVVLIFMRLDYFTGKFAAGQ